MTANTLAKELEHSNCLLELGDVLIVLSELTRASPIKEYYLFQTASKSVKLFSLFYLVEPFLFTVCSYLMKLACSRRSDRKYGAKRKKKKVTATGTGYDEAVNLSNSQNCPPSFLLPYSTFRTTDKPVFKC